MMDKEILYYIIIFSGIILGGLISVGVLMIFNKILGTNK